MKLDKADQELFFLQVASLSSGEGGGGGLPAICDMYPISFDQKMITYICSYLIYASTHSRDLRKKAFTC
jgi:hypothetical protein